MLNSGKMKRFGIVLLSVCVLALCGCSRGRVIPEKTFTRIYQEMFLADQWLAAHPEYKGQADSTLFYEPIFRKHGFRTRDFHRSIDYYLARPEKYQHLMQAVQDGLEKEYADMRQMIDRQRIQEQNASPLQRQQ